MKPSELKQALIDDRGSFCERCVFQAGYPGGLEVHHCLIHRSKRFPQLDDPMNCQLLCRTCHSSGEVNGHPWRVKFLRSQHEKYKRDDVTVYNWFINLPEKLQRTNEWILNELMSIETEELV